MAKRKTININPLDTIVRHPMARRTSEPSAAARTRSGGGQKEAMPMSDITGVYGSSIGTGLKLAAGYSKSANILVKYSGQTRERAVIHSLMVLRALALEIYFRCLYSFDHKKQYDGHNIKRIYDALDGDTRRRIKEYYDGGLAESEFIKHTHAKHHEIKGHAPNLDLEHVLQEWGSAFDNWRYFYDAKHRVVFLAYGEIEKAVLRRIRELAPEGTLSS